MLQYHTCLCHEHSHGPALYWLRFCLSNALTFWAFRDALSATQKEGSGSISLIYTNVVSHLFIVTLLLFMRMPVREKLLAYIIAHHTLQLPLMYLRLLSIFQY